MLSMNSVAFLLVGAMVLVGCRSDSTTTDGLEARLKKLEETNAKYAEAFEFLQKIHEQQKHQQVAQERDEPAPDAIFAVDIAPNLKAGLVEGPAAGAPVTIVEAWDFGSPYCERASALLEDLVKEYNGKVRVVFKNMVVHPQVTNAHLAGCAAGKLGKFTEFKRAFWEQGFKPRKMDDATIESIAKGIAGLDLARWKLLRDGEECKQLVQNDMSELQKFRVGSTPPTLFINGTHVATAPTKESLKQLVEDKLKTAGNQADYYDKVVMATGEKQFRSKSDPKPN